MKLCEVRTRGTTIEPIVHRHHHQSRYGATFLVELKVVKQKTKTTGTGDFHD
jgi:hypothetical protein